VKNVGTTKNRSLFFRNWLCTFWTDYPNPFCNCCTPPSSNFCETSPKLDLLWTRRNLSSNCSVIGPMDIPLFSFLTLFESPNLSLCKQFPINKYIVSPDFNPFPVFLHLSPDFLFFPFPFLRVSRLVFKEDRRPVISLSNPLSFLTPRLEYIKLRFFYLVQETNLFGKSLV